MSNKRQNTSSPLSSLQGGFMGPTGGHEQRMLSSLQFIVLPCCTAAQTRPVPHVALRSYRGRGGFAPGIFRTRKFGTGFISHSGLKIPREISHPSRIVLFTTGQFLHCTAKFQRVAGLFCEFLGASRIAFFTFRGVLHGLDLNPMPQTHLPFGCCAATNMWTPKTSLSFGKKF